MSDPAFPHIHDHRACMTATLAAAETLARTRGQRLTPLRRRVLEIVLESHRPTGAYDVLASLARDRTRPAPPTVYRALEFLLGQGFVHRIDSLSAFVGCFAPEKAHRSRFFLCLRCGRAAEIEDDNLDKALVAAAAGAGFAAERETVELAGVCGDCANTPSVGAASG